MEISLTTWRPGWPQLILFVLYQPQFTVTKQSTSENTASRKLLPFGNIKFESETEKLSSHFQKRVIAYWKLLSFLPLDSVQNLRCTIRRWGPWQVLGNGVRSKDGRMWGARYGVDCIQCICKCLCRGLMTGGRHCCSLYRCRDTRYSLLWGLTVEDVYRNSNLSLPDHKNREQ